jgi:hypothetical protein
MIYEIMTQKSLKALQLALEETIRTGHSLVGTSLSRRQTKDYPVSTK